MLAVWVEQLLNFASGALAAIRKDEHYPALMAWARAKGTALLGGNMAMAQALAPELWSQTPLERLDFACEPLARPEPNEPCWCDSGHKTKHCCGAVKLPGAIPEHLMWMLSLRDWKGPALKAALASHQAPPQALLEAGLISAEGGQRGRAQQLLEALFAQSDWARLPEQAEPAFELLIDLYQERGFSHKRDALLEAVFEHGPLELRGGALERLCLMHLDNDDLASAREAFIHAQQTLPDSPTLAYIEAMLLLHEGHVQEASERARFWFRRLSRQGGLDPEQLEFLAELADNPGATLAEQMVNAEEELAEPLAALQELLKVVQGAPRLDLRRSAEGELEYHTSAREAALFDAFQQHFQASVDEDAPLGFKDEPWANAENWLVALCANPEWLDSPRVVQSLILALTLRFGSLPWMAPSLFEPLAYRLEGWLSQIEALRDENQGGELLWDVADNAVLLRTGLALVVGMERGAREHSRALAERLLALDEQDSLGLLELVLDQLLRDGRDAKALDVSEISAQPPLLGTLMGRALAFYRLERFDEAARAVREASRLNSHVIRLLCESRPKRGANLGRGERNSAEPEPGSHEEAWQYRTLMRDQWIATPGALEWLDQQA
ncbi:SEC-C metal-binding domain-containing protein [Pistricoccus aurantiacus]|uniref:SEC-C metal-binding domain-containing protein n=1 Tax=Pistricoccus aurantiacus TaxID=1883414 RepID=UPI00363550A7